MSWVTVCRKGPLKYRGKFKCKFTPSMLFSLKLICGDHLYNNPDDEEVKALYAELPTRESLTVTRSWNYGGQIGTYSHISKNPPLYLDAIHLNAIRKMLPKIINGGWTQDRAVEARIKSFDEIPALVMLAAACE